MATGKGLGKGLNLIFNAGMTEETANGENPVKSIRISEIEPNPGQPRHNFDPIALEELAQSIRENGFGRENIPAMMAAVVVISVPLVILFLIFRKKIMAGVARGGTKG